MANQSGLSKLNQQIINCTACPRLSNYTREVARNKVRRHADFEYWGKPVPGFGDPMAKALIVGLAPAAHGANRTGRMFTGDSSGEWLFKALYETGFASQSGSTEKNDGMVLSDVYIGSVIHCAPPANKPLKEEIDRCAPFLRQHVNELKKLRAILCMGGIAFRQTCKTLGLSSLKFGHNHSFELESGLKLISSYHPSRQNTNTGRLTWVDWIKVFTDLQLLIQE